MKKLFVLVMALALLLGISPACAEEPDYYRIGLEAAGLLDEIVNSDVYLSLTLVMNDRLEAVREAVNTHDYDSPVAVYEVRLDDVRGFVESSLDPENKAQWDSLPDRLQEQVLLRMGVQTFIARLNSMSGAEYISFASAANAVLRKEELTGEKAVYYLYIFEKGTPVLVSFGYHSAAASFVFIPEESRGSLSGIREALGYFEVEPVEMKK